MKLFIVLALATVAAAEADPAYLYGSNFGYNFAASPYAFGGYNNLYAASPYAYNRFAGYGLNGYAAHTGLAYNGFHGLNRYYANSGGAVNIVKRDAEADPALLYGSNFGYNFGATPYGLNAFNGFNGHYNNFYSHGLYNNAFRTPYAYNNYNSYAALPAVAGGYAAAGRYFAKSGNTVHVAKRDADADPALLYGSNFGYNYGATPYAFGGYNNFAARSYNYAPFANTYASRGAYSYAPFAYNRGFNGYRFGGYGYFK